MDVLLFECQHENGGLDYRIIISTATIKYAWERFERRVKDSSQSYCDYSSLREGTLYLIYPWDKADNLQVINPVVPQIEWKEKHPVLFETCEYQFAVEFYHLHDTSNSKVFPKVKHNLKSVCDSFKFYPNGEHSGILVGSINFLNNPGKFNFSFEYHDDNDQLKKEQIKLYVASPKLDTKNDLNKITSLINQEYENYVFDYLTLTFSSFSLARKTQNNNIVWLSIFKNIVDDYFRNVRYVISRPNNRTVRKTYYDRPEKIRRWNPQQEERYHELGKDAERYYFRNEQIERTTNTRENRFVKYSLHVLGKKFNEVFKEIGRLFKVMDDSERRLLETYRKEFKQLERNSFFDKVGEFEGFRQESSILQQRSGYSHIYKDWLVLKNSLDLIDGETNIGMKQIWELYEIWCYLIMKRLVAKVLDIDLDDAELVREDKEGMLNSLLKSEMAHFIEFTNPSNQDVIRLEYQHTYNRQSGDFKSTTTEQRPDIVLTIKKPDGFVLTYLYDAKYRVQDDIADGDLDKDADIDIADYPIPDAINQMHRYRDAIYYEMKDDERPRAKEVIGGYILFPGRTEGSSILNRYFFKSIEKINIGAFPLLPANNEQKGKLVQDDHLENHLREIILNNSAYEQLKASIPQKGLRYQSRDNNSGVALVMMEQYFDKRSKFSNGKIALPIKLTEAGMTLLENQANISYVLFHTRKKDDNKHLFKVNGIIRILSKDDARSDSYYLIQSTSHKYICLEFDLSKELDSKELDPSIANIEYESPQERYDPQYSTMKELLLQHDGN